MLWQVGVAGINFLDTFVNHAKLPIHLEAHMTLGLLTIAAGIVLMTLTIEGL